MKNYDLTRLAFDGWLFHRNPEKAIAELAKMVPTVKERKQVIAMAMRVAAANGRKGKRENAMLTAIKKALGLA